MFLIHFHLLLLQSTKENHWSFDKYFCETEKLVREAYNEQQESSHDKEATSMAQEREKTFVKKNLKREKKGLKKKPKRVHPNHGTKWERLENRLNRRLR